MSSSATNFVSLLLLTVRFVTMRTKLVKIVVKSVIGNTIAQSNETLLPISSVAFVAMLVIWPVIARIGQHDSTLPT